MPWGNLKTMSGPAYRLIPTDIWSMGTAMTEVCRDTNIILKAASVHKARPTSSDEKNAS